MQMSLGDLGKKKNIAARGVAVSGCSAAGFDQGSERSATEAPGGG